MRILALLLFLASGSVLSQSTPAPPQKDAGAWLAKVYSATQRLSYTGTFVYRQGERSESSRITRLVEGTSETERLEVLDGVRREIVRKGDEVRCYLPESMTIKVDRRTDRRSFPSLLPAQVAELAENYSITMGETARIAGYDCQAIVLSPKDGYRYGYKLWADVKTGMPLKARIFNDKGDAVEEFTFTQLTIGGNISREMLKPRFLAKTRDWKVEDASVVPARLADTGWQIRPDLPGFQKIVEVSRKLGESRQVNQIVFSDGLAAISVFIEPGDRKADAIRPGLSSMGAINIFTRDMGNHTVTVVGETPPVSVRKIANAVEYRRPQ